MRTEIKQLWLNALRSGEYPRGEGQLRSSKGNFCPLGVLCDLHSKAENGVWFEGTYLNADCWLPIQVIKWAGLDHPGPKLLYPCKWYSKKYQHTVPWLNDKLHLSFSEIADLIEGQL